MIDIKHKSKLAGYIILSFYRFYCGTSMKQSMRTIKLLKLIRKKLRKKFIYRPYVCIIDFKHI